MALIVAIAHLFSRCGPECGPEASRPLGKNVPVGIPDSLRQRRRVRARVKYLIQQFNSFRNQSGMRLLGLYVNPVTRDGSERAS